MGNCIVQCKLTEESKNYLMTNKELNDEEIQQWNLVFTQDYPKGKNTLEEGGNILKSLFEYDTSPDQMITLLFKSYDRYEEDI